MASDHILKRFDEELERLNATINEMGGLTESQFAKALAAVRDRDSATAEEVIADDARVDALDVAVQEQTVKLLAPPPNGLGASLRVSQGDWRYALGVQQLDDVTGDNSGMPYLVGELGRRNIFPLKGHYRWWARGSSVRERRQDLTWGTGVSLDQLVTDTTGLFLRAGLGRSEGDRVLSHSVLAGVQHTPAWLGRDKDLVGVGYGFLREADGREHVAETYYNLALAECCSLIANVEWLRSRPAGHRHDEHRVVPGLRAVILF